MTTIIGISARGRHIDKSVLYDNSPKESRGQVHDSSTQSIDFPNN